MAVSVMARCGPSLRPSQGSCGSRRVQGPCARAPVSFVRMQPAGRMQPAARAFYRGVNWNDEEAMKEVLQDMAKMWKEYQASGRTAGGFFWPGGGYVYGTGHRCKPDGSAADTPSAAAAASAADDGSKGLALDVVSTDGFYLVYADVPGLSKSDLSIKLNKQRVLTIAGERKAPVEAGYSQKERRFGSFERSWSLPDDADSEGISAKVTEGVLSITVPKKQPEPEVDDSQDIAIN